ncbi:MULTISPECIES: hypothetical protein [Gracilibacillus]|uniref:Uncharacterized protein n=1 Tax=Gracilibacillus dipsosauri TaxID=178340 RepID=A0A317L308_9BACI|nr:hypothetical protein [Gracilibacillus dipsosauri]PWU69866.1 hypothetical protein DLJ74_02745 [Gracilibacillus dipsosauri]
MIVLRWFVRFWLLLSIPVLSVLYAGLLVSAILIILAGLFRTFGFEQIKMSIWPSVELPIMFSIPLSLGVSILLFIASYHIGKSIRYCMGKLAN